MDSGYIKLWRKITSWEWYKDTNTFCLFIHLLLTANYKTSRFMGYEIARGSLVCGRKSLSEDTGISQRSIRTSLKNLKSTSEVTIKVTSKFSIVTLCNYEKYQDQFSDGDQQSDQQSDQHSTSIRPAFDQQVTTSKECKKERRKEIRDFTPPEHLAEIWPHFEEMRNKKRKPMTNRARMNIVLDLMRIDPTKELHTKILDQSITNSYQGVFPLKVNNQAPAQQKDGQAWRAQIA